MNLRTTIRILVVFALSLSLATLLGIGPYSPEILPVRGDAAPPAGANALTFFTPSGPSSDKILYNVFTDVTAEIASFQAGQVDLTDTPLPASSIPVICSSTSFYCTGLPFCAKDPCFNVPPDSELGMAEIDFNHANSFFGITDCFGQDGINTGSQCTVPTGASPPGYPLKTATCPANANPPNNCTAAMINFRQGVAYILDKNALVNISSLGGFASPLDNPLSPAQTQPHSGLPLDGLQQGQSGPTWTSYSNGGYVLGGVCSWDKLSGTGCASAFHHGGDGVSSDGITVNVGSPDFIDAGAHWVVAGLASAQNPDGTLCEAFPGKCYWSAAINPSSPGYGGPVIFVIRNDALPRLAIGSALATKLCQMIGSTSATPTNVTAIKSCEQIKTESLNPVQAFCVVFCIDSAGGPSLAWHIYTGAFTLNMAYDQEYALYNSQAASNFCLASSQAITAGSFVPNYVYFCNQKHDHYTNQLEFNGTFNGATASLQTAMDIFGNHTATVPVYVKNQVFAYLKGWTGVSDATGIGIATGNPWTLLNAWNPSPAISGPTIRWGMVQGTSSLNPYLFSTIHEANVLQEIYDTLLTIAPYIPRSGSNAGVPFILPWMGNGYNLVTHATDPGCPSSITRLSEPGVLFTVSECLKLNLRGDDFFHDGLQVTASDVKFSFESINATAYQSYGTENVADVVYNPTILPTPLGGTEAPGQRENLYIALKSSETFSLENLATIFILPQHLWHTIGSTGPCLTEDTPQCQVDPSFLTGPGSDPATLANHMLIGSGPYVCASGDLGAQGTVLGGACTSSSLSSVTAGGTITLRRFASGLEPTNTGYSRNNANYKQWEWANLDRSGTVDASDISAIFSCRTATAPLTGACLHFDTQASGLLCTPAGPCIGQNSGGDSDGLVTVMEESQVLRWSGTSWTGAVAYSQLSTPEPNGGGAQTAPQTIYDDGSVYQPPPPPP